MNTTMNLSPTGACLIPSISITRFKDAIFIPLPTELWRATPGGGCCCQFCKAEGSPGFWDTLALSATLPKNPHADSTYTVHHPGLQPAHLRKEMAARANAPHLYNNLADNGYCFVCGLGEAQVNSNHLSSLAES
jgi:hypothetical protein